MNQRAIEVCLDLVKIDLCITTSAYDSRLMQTVKATVQAITSEGIELESTSVGDIQLVTMYATWLWNKRRTGEGMPRMIRYALNNKLFGRKGENNG